MSSTSRASRTLVQFEGFLKESERKVLACLESSSAVRFFHPDDLRECVWSYIRRPAKRLRPAVLLMSCGSVGGKMDAALPAAAGIEVFHTWTLVHDDLIDNDRTRRGSPTVHAAMDAQYQNRDGGSPQKAEEFGRDMAILTGDMQHGWAVTLFLDCGVSGEVDPEVLVSLVGHLQSNVLGKLIQGEVLDVKFGMARGSQWQEIDETQIVEMLYLKTGVLYGFAGLAGGAIGLNTQEFAHPLVDTLTRFAAYCGTAFQLQDDILGVIGDEEALGKPVGSDIREGKKTVIVFEALKNGTESQRKEILAVLGNKEATEDEVRLVSRLFHDLGGIHRTRELAEVQLGKAKPLLDRLPSSPYRDLLNCWADSMIKRTF